MIPSYFKWNVFQKTGSKVGGNWNKNVERLIVYLDSFLKEVIKFNMVGTDLSEFFK